jgi:NADPH:quinone reductase-like Zn-dependent oxidoreductase
LATVNEWKEVLSMSGFDGKHATIADNGLCTTTFASLATQIVPDKPHVSLLCQDPNGHVPKMVSMALEKQGFAVDFVKFADDPTQDVISILDFEQNSGFFECITSQNYGLFNAFVMRLQASSGILWLTKACQMRCTDPQFAQIIGLARTLRSELALDVATIELDGPVDDVSVMNAVCQVYRKFRQRPKDQDTDAEYEYAFANGKVHIPRYYWFSVTDSLASESPDGAQAKRLEVGKKGSLKSLQWIPQAANTELIGNEVTVQVQAVGMNFKDILMAMGIIEGARVEANGLGCECTGIVQQVGPDVRGLMVGDRVCIAAPHTYATLVSTTSDHCAKMPDDLSFEDGATMPCVYGTVIHGLLDLAGLERGQTVLIHSACGGIGIAAINICRMVGAKVYATVGSEEKIEYLERAFHLPRNHIFSSRDATFMDGVMRETAGKGVDVALNSLSGDLLHTTVSVVTCTTNVTNQVISGNVSQSLGAWSKLGSVTSWGRAGFPWIFSSLIARSLVSISPTCIPTDPKRSGGEYAPAKVEKRILTSRIVS